MASDQSFRRAWTRCPCAYRQGADNCSGDGRLRLWKDHRRGALAAALGSQFQEGDDLHPPKNVEKMHSGTPLTDADRLPWLHKIAEVIDGWRARGDSGVLTCSALKRSYRDIIIGDRPGVTLIYMKGSPDLVHERMAARHEHFMPCGLARQPVQTLEEPTTDEHPIIVNVGDSPAGIVSEIVRQLEERHRPEPAS